MVHYECYVCSMVASCVLNASSNLAWHDHMANHADPTLFGQWVWTVVALPFGS